MRKSILVAAALLAGVCAGGTVKADDAIGKIDVYHVNVTVTGGRTGCIQMRFPNPLPGGWGCVYGSGTLVDDINELLRTAAQDSNSKKCRVFWSSLDGNGFAQIYAAECGPRH